MYECTREDREFQTWPGAVLRTNSLTKLPTSFENWPMSTEQNDIEPALAR